MPLNKETQTQFSCMFISENVIAFFQAKFNFNNLKDVSFGFLPIEKIHVP